MSKPQLNTRVLTDFKYRPFIQTQETEVMIIVLVGSSGFGVKLFNSLWYCNSRKTKL